MTIASATTTATSSSALAGPAGRWQVDPAHSAVEFRVRHAGVARVRGAFERFHGTLEIEAGGAMRAEGTIEAGSLNTRLEARDRHLRSEDFFDVERHPAISFVSTAIETGPGSAITVHGDLTIRGVTRAIALQGELLGRGVDDEGAERLGIALEGRIDRRDYGLTWNAAVEGGGVLVGHRVDIALEVSAVR